MGIHEVRDFKEHWFSFGDCCLAVSEVGRSQGEHVLLFLHGRFGQGEMWRPLIRRLADHFKCLHLDLPGFGRSFSVRGRGFSLLEQSHLIKHVLGRFLPRGRKAVLVGHDVGGAIAQLCAIHDPGALSGLVLINSAALTQPPRDLQTGWLCLHARLKLHNLLKSVSHRLEPEARALLRQGWDDHSMRASLMQAFRTWEYTWPGPFERHTWKEEIRKLGAPVLLLWGKGDIINPPDHAEELMRTLPEAYLFEQDACGHWPCLEDAEWVSLKLREFVFRLDARAPRKAQTGTL